MGPAVLLQCSRPGLRLRRCLGPRAGSAWGEMDAEAGETRMQQPGAAASTSTAAAVPFDRSSSRLGAPGAESFDGALRVRRNFARPCRVLSRRGAAAALLVSLRVVASCRVAPCRSSRICGLSCTKRRTAARRRSATPTRRSCKQQRRRRP